MNILQDILGLFKRNKFTTPKNKDVIYVARNQKQSHIVEPKLDSKVMELKSLKDWVLTGVVGGKEHFYVDTLLNEVDASGQRSIQGQPAALGISGYGETCIPFSFKQDVLLKKVHIAILNGLPFQGNIGEPEIVPAYLGLYKFDSTLFNVDYNDILFNFTKVYQDPSSFNVVNVLNETTQEITLETPQTMKAGEVYVVVVVHESPFAGQFYAPDVIETNQMLGLITTVTGQTAQNEFTFDYTQLEATPPDANAKGLGPIPIVSGQLPNTISFLREGTQIGSGGQRRMGGWKWMTVKNA
jgi:hypothetical protein